MLRKYLHNFFYVIVYIIMYNKYYYVADILWRTKEIEQLHRIPNKKSADISGQTHIGRVF